MLMHTGKYKRKIKNRHTKKTQPRKSKQRKI